MNEKKILAFDCSSRNCSGAILSNNEIIDVFHVDSVSNHSQTLLKSIIEMLERNKISLSDISHFALTIGPGSFTGLKIGVSTVKGLAFKDGQKCLTISTLEALAYSSAEGSGLIISSLDARHGVVFAAAFRKENGKICRLTEDIRIESKEFFEKIAKKYPGEKIILCGDGSTYFSELSSSNGIDFVKDSAAVTGSGFLSVIISGDCNIVDSEKLVPNYLRPSQAERELNNR